MDKGRRDQEFMSIIAYLYYYADMNQSDIADRLFLSRSTVSRLIKKARQSGVVELKINEPWDRDLSMEDKLRTCFSIKSARVLCLPESMGKEAVLDMLGQAATFYVSCNVQNQSILGMSWGNTISHVNNTITTMQNIPLTVVPIMGTMTYPDTNPESLKLSQRFARIYGGRFFPLDAPLFASSKEQLAELLADPGIAEAINTSRNADLIITSVGSIEDRSWDRVFGMDRLSRLKEIGCVGHIGGHFIDINGHEIDGTYKDLHIGLSLDEIRANEYVMCVADSPRKAEAVYAALRGGLVNTLIVTYPLAQRIMEIVQERSL
ncbi:MAG: winged helix-turn-helix transcriptional regulator [Clostridia bacterium]|nr:winged helix-turn-helix transcriptional regulator [Clostridia bacterium]